MSLDLKTLQVGRRIPISKNIIIEGYIRTIEQTHLLSIPKMIVKFILYYLYFGYIFQFYTKQFIGCCPNLLSQTKTLKEICNLFKQYKFDRESIEAVFNYSFNKDLIDTLAIEHYNGIAPNHSYILKLLETLCCIQEYSNSSILIHIPQEWLWRLSLHFHYHIETITAVLYLWGKMCTDTRTRCYFLDKRAHWLFAVIISNVTTENHIVDGASDIINRVSFLIHQLAIYHRKFRGQSVHETLLHMIPLMLYFVLDKKDNQCTQILLNISKTLLTIICNEKDIVYYYEHINDPDHYNPYDIEERINHNFTFCHNLFIILTEKKLLRKYIDKTINSGNNEIKMLTFKLIHSISVIHNHWRLQESVELLLSADYIDIMIQNMKFNTNMSLKRIQIFSQWKEYLKFSRHGYYHIVSNNSGALEIIITHLTCKQDTIISQALGCVKEIVKTAIYMDVEIVSNAFSWKNGKMVDNICDAARSLNEDHYNKFKIMLIFIYLSRLIESCDTKLYNEIANGKLSKLLKNKLRANNILRILQKFSVIDNNNQAIQSNIKLYESEITLARQYVEILISSCN